MHSYFAAAFATLLILFIAGCADDPGYEHLYTTRGIILSLPGEMAYQEFIIHHETIPHYRSINGSIGMNEMAMPIPVPDRSILQGINVGDKVELTFGERFKPDHIMGVTAIKKLPADTELNLSKTTSNP